MGREIGSIHTATVVTKVVDLVIPLRHYPQGVLKEGNHDKKAADGWKVSAVSPQHVSGQVNECLQPATIIRRRWHDQRKHTA